MLQIHSTMKWKVFLANTLYGSGFQEKLINENKTKMYTTLEDLDPSKVREAFLTYELDFESVNPDEIACLLRMAVLKNDAEYAFAILDRVPDILTHDNGGGKILWHAFENGNEILAKKLIESGADLNYRSRNGSTFLHRFMHKHRELAQLMIEKGADFNIYNCGKKTVLYVAVQDELWAVVRAIIRRNIRYEDEDHVLQLAASSPRATDLLPLLIRSTRVNTKKSRARKALIYYLQESGECGNLIRTLIEAALMPRFTDRDVIAILKHVVMFEKCTNVARILLDYVEMLNGNSEDVALLLCRAAKYSKSTMSTLLIHKGANVNGHTKDHDYPLHNACLSGSLQNLHLLLSLGANPMVTDVEGHTPFGCMPVDTFQEHHKLVLRHLAIRHCRNLPIHSDDVEKIRQQPRMQRYYDECLNELLEMREIRIYGDATFFCFFDMRLEELADLARDLNFLRNYYLNQKEGNVAFPHYSMHIHNVFRMAIDRKNILLARARIYEQAIMEAPPYDRIVSHIAPDMPELENFERTFYLQLHERLNDVHELGYRMNLLC